MSEQTMAAMLARASRRVRPATIVDVGASTGLWSAVALRCWPEARVLCIEADERHREGLRAFAAKHRAEAVHAMAGDHVGTGHFAFADDPYGGQGSDHPRADTREVPCTTVDYEVERLGLPGPYLLKLDTHGYEGQILHCAHKTLRQSCALVIEAYACKLQAAALRFWELCFMLAARPETFIPTDMADPMWRPLDGRLWQMDFLFERASEPMVGLGRYR